VTWILFLAIIGIVLICIEFFVPGLVIGIIGTLLLVTAVVLTYFKYGVTTGNLAMLGAVVICGLALAMWVLVIPKTKLARRLVMEKNLGDSKTASSLTHLMGKTGKALTPLRPSGTATFGEERVDVAAESGLIDAESSIKVVRVEGNHVVVRKIES
jgi:membrane-bound serine protease (ClpP class)